ncbi:MAG: TetR/AcrR family transcriptional regulator [Planctomycetota bacterium]|nr:MAG: TetR/AcrR family transcriptional regulator [Planctomycetota bacterium]
MSRLPAAERREQLLDCAAKLFAKQGYARATTAQLAKSAGVTEPIIYRHFKSKRDLFVALIERTGRQTLEQWERDLRGATDPADRLRRLIGDNPMVSEEGRDAYRVFLQAISEVDDEKIQQAIARHIGSVHEFLTAELAKAQQAHRVTTKYSAEMLGWLMINIGMGYGVLSAMRIPGHGKDASGVHVQDVLARVLVGQRGQSG